MKLIPYLLIIICSFKNLIIKAQPYNIYCGTYTDKNVSMGIYVLSYNPSTQKIKKIASTYFTPNPSYLALSKNKNIIYAVNETTNGAVSVFKFNNKKNTLDCIQKKSVFGDDPCYISLSSDEKFIVISNYSSGNLVVYSLLNNGLLSNKYQVIQHTQHSINKSRQQNAHVHSAFFYNNNKNIISADLGEDNLYNYFFNPLNFIDKNKVSIIKTTDGGGPRHIAVSSNNQYMYVSEELTGTVAVYKNINNTFQQIQNISSHPNINIDFKGDFSSADIHLSNDGKNVYVSNRGIENNIVCFSIDKINGKLQYEQTISSGGIKPRNFVIHSNDTDVWVANQTSNNIVLFNRDKKTGKLKQTKLSIEIPNPVCLKIK